MNKYLSIKLLIIAMFIYSKCTGQVRVGVKAGLNAPTLVGENYFSAHNYKIRNSVQTIYFHAGITSDVRLSRFFAIQPEVLYSTSGYEWFSAEEEFNSSNSTDEPDVAETLGVVMVPLLLRVKLGGLGLVFGPQLNRLVTARRSSRFGSKYDVRSDYETDPVFSAVIGLEYTFSFGLGLHARYNYCPTSIARVTDKGIYAPGNSMYNHTGMGGLHFYFFSKKEK
ncbi:porin family protein [Dyadobacter sp. CY343]|uniref:porin family protein n=1 Tax=Dyadobacter sp. CY343 TaxID=2907299 RepID=UPI001F1E71B2|nr:porin family protein [Dyadobacter sp. CY343]MCE7062202.1 PorT family protein [Dyadobacter sp. CY343]